MGTRWKQFLFRCWVCIFSVWMAACSAYASSFQEDDAQDSSNFISSGELLVDVSLLRDAECDESFSTIRETWNERTVVLPNDSGLFSQPTCRWSRTVFTNHGQFTQVRYVHFPQFWGSVVCYYQSGLGNFEKALVGSNEQKSFLRIEIPAHDTSALFMFFPTPSDAQVLNYQTALLTSSEVDRIPFRTSIKYFLLGVLLFPFFFFLAQFLIERDRLNFAYLMFLLGAGLNLITILEASPFFGTTPKLLLQYLPFESLQRMFVVSIFLCLGGLMKYVHYLLDIRCWNDILRRIGNGLLWIHLGVSVVPFLFSRLFLPVNYESYLVFLRFSSLVLVVYILVTCIWALIRKVSYSSVVVLAFAPFVLGALYYALNFVVRGMYSNGSGETIVLLIGFFLTMLLFGIILGLRNNVVKREKVLLKQKADHLAHLDHFKSRFYTNLTHEFRTPLTVINGLAGEITGFDTERKMIQRNCDRLLSTVNQLLELARLESETQSTHFIQGDVITFLQYLTESCTSLANQKHIHLAFFSPLESLIMDYDSTKLQQILINLISNAIKFTPEFGSVKIVASTSREAGESMLHIRVIDTGSGISQDQLPYIFDRFYQVEDGDQRSADGSGIGLSLVKELVRLLDGRVEVSSQPDRGSSFSVYLPIHTHACQPTDGFSEIFIGSDNISEPLLEDALTEENDFAGSLVLLIEDNADVSHYIVSCLRPSFSIATARNGKIGLDKALSLIPDVIISDVMMPVMDGFEVCRAVKADVRTSHIPVLLLTAKATREDRVSGFECGADAYLTKPFDKEELLIRLKNLTQISKHLRDSLSGNGNLQIYQDEKSKREAEFLVHVDECIEAFMEDQEFNTTKLCREVAMSRTQLHRKLKALTGESTAKYIRRRRMLAARDLLRRTDLPVGQISVQVGYKDFSHFSRSYLHEFSQSPSQERN